jgi:hypothetical protein
LVEILESLFKRGDEQRAKSFEVGAFVGGIRDA